MIKKPLTYVVVALILSQPCFAETKKDNIFKRVVNKIGNAIKIESPGKSSKILNVAKSQVGSYYRPGVKAQCANFVGHVVTKAGGEKPSSASFARSWLKWGKPVNWSSKKPGDIIVTWRGSRSGTYGHILIYAGDNTAIHRSTSGKKVGYVDVANYSSKVLGVRRAA